MSQKVQRLRVTYARGVPLRYVSHLDMMRFWERAIRRAHLPVAYSEGFSPHVQIALGPPLNVGLTGRAELIDIFLHEPMGSEAFRARLQEQMPPGVLLTDVCEAPLGGPALQALVRAADYCMHLRVEADVDRVLDRIAFFLAADVFPWEQMREKEMRRYDLRPLVLNLSLDREYDDGPAILTRLRAEDGATGRADQLALALGIADEITLTERVAFVLAAPAQPVVPPAVLQ